MPVIKLSIYKDYKEVKGTFVGGCVIRGDGSRFRAKAHTHANGKYKGWICILSMKRIEIKEILLHELAHAITNQGHTDKWRAKLLELGGTLDEVYEANGKTVMLMSYHKKKR